MGNNSHKSSHERLASETEIKCPECLALKKISRDFVGRNALIKHINSDHDVTGPRLHYYRTLFGYYQKMIDMGMVKP